LAIAYFIQVARWVAKARAEAARGVTSVFLIPARTGARWWIDCHEAADVILLTGRVQFLRPLEALHKPASKSQSATFDSALVVFRPQLGDDSAAPREYWRWDWKRKDAPQPGPFHDAWIVDGDRILDPREWRRLRRG